MRISNKAKQQELDRMKWNLSQIEQKDLSGKMDYCNYCPQQFDGCVCNIGQHVREQECLCAKAFNRKNNIK